jgi:hypothetical protein
MPPLPAAHGFMNLGEPTILLSERPGAAQKGYRVGDTIGAFKLLALSGSEIVFEWDGQKVVRPLEELLAEGVKQAPAQSPERSTPAPQPAATSTLTTVTPPASVSGPGAPITAEIKACQAGDTSPPGTIVAGLKKVVNETPFGKACRWEPVK